MEHLFPYPKMGHSFLEILEDQLTHKLLGFSAIHAEKQPFVDGVASRLKFLLQDPTRHLSFLKIGYTALEAFLQANCTGPPLDFNPENAIFPEPYRAEIPDLKRELLSSLSVDGNSVYSLTPHIELFWLAKLIMGSDTLAEAGFNGRRARFRVNFWHQKLLTEKSDSLQSILYEDVEVLEHQLASRLAFGGAAAEEHFVEFLMERAAIRIHYGDDEKARHDLTRAATTRHFQFAMTGALGRRTKFQTFDTSQLVVLARSRDFEPEPYSSRKSSRTEGMESRKGSQTESPSLSRNPSEAGVTHLTSPHTHHPPTLQSLTSLPTHHHKQLSPRLGEHEHHISPLAAAPTTPENIPLNEETLLERINFKQTPAFEPILTQVSDTAHLPPRLAMLDPAEQPLLFPMDSIILLATAESISNTSPADGLTREETLPYATRVLEGGSSNWQVYTQALLVRSRIEGYKSRTAERGLLQLQALVDQVIAETQPTAVPKSNVNDNSEEQISAANTFLPKPKAGESASVAERLKYIYQLSPPLRWELEAELAARWTSMGGLKTALEIYQRLQMQAEVALCLAATDREAEAVKLLKNMIFVEDHTGVSKQDNNDSGEAAPKILTTRNPPPEDCPRLLCILGDITKTPDYYELAWEVSGNRYARAQRSLGRYYVKARSLPAAAEAFRLAIDRSLLDRGTWFAYGCVQLELEDWAGAVETFTRCVQLEDKDAESWSNLAIALLKLPPDVSTEMSDFTASIESNANSDGPQPPAVNAYKHSYEALRALRRAATISRDDARIWDNYLTVAAGIPPSAGTPWAEIIQSMTRVIELRSKKQGEGAIDLTILTVLVNYVTQTWTHPSDVADDAGNIADTTIPEEDEPAEETGLGIDIDATTGSDDDYDDENQGPTDLPRIVTRNDDYDNNNNPTPATPSLASTTETSTPTTQPPSTPTTTTTTPKRLPYIPRAFLSLIDNHITPLVTSNPHLYTLLARVSIWRARPAESLSYIEKAWRATTAVPDVYATEQGWTEIVARTTELVQAYRTLGDQERERTGGKVEQGWRFKARTAVRSVLGRGKENWEGTSGWKDLETEREELS